LRHEDGGQVVRSNAIEYGNCSLEKGVCVCVFFFWYGIGEGYASATINLNDGFRIIKKLYKYYVKKFESQSGYMRL
jgi:hypothetical protein